MGLALSPRSVSLSSDDGAAAAPAHRRPPSTKKQGCLLTKRRLCLARSRGSFSLCFSAVAGAVDARPTAAFPQEKNTGWVSLSLTALPLSLSSVAGAAAAPFHRRPPSTKNKDKEGGWGCRCFLAPTTTKQQYIFSGQFFFPLASFPRVVLRVLACGLAYRRPPVPTKITFTNNFVVSLSPAVPLRIVPRSLAHRCATALQWKQRVQVTVICLRI